MPNPTERVLLPATRMDQAWYAYSPFPDRQPLRWPQGARIALWVSVSLECMDPLHPAEYPGSNVPILGQPTVRNASELDYGNRVGVWRVMEALDRYGLRGTAAVDLLTAARYPEIVEESLKRDWEIMAHGEAGSHPITSKLSIDEERELIARSRDGIAAVTGCVPNGWMGAGGSESINTPGLLAEAGFSYTADWCNDDQPYRMNVEAGSLFALPYSMAVNDVDVIFEQHHTPWEFEQAGWDHFESLYEEARNAGTGFVMCVALHPFCIGQPYRIKYLEQMLEHIRSYAGVWPATGSEIVECYRGQTAP
jgi:peptidoglycan/xylan/chitin deacetylase (PgdA/CDA1 family)